MIVKQIDKKMIIAYDEWNGKVEKDNYYILAEVDFFDQFMKIKVFQPITEFVKCREYSGLKPEKFDVEQTIDVLNFGNNNNHEKKEFVQLYISTYSFIEKLIKEIVGYDLVCMPYGKYFPLMAQKKQRREKLTRILYKRIEKIYLNVLEGVDSLFRIDQLEKSFYAVSGRAIFLDFMYSLSNVKFFPDEYLRKDILKYRGASYAFVTAIRNDLGSFRNCCFPVPNMENGYIILSERWNWRDYLCPMYEFRTRGTNRFLDKFPGAIPLGFRLYWNTFRNPDRIYLMAHKIVQQYRASNIGRHIDPKIINIIERSTNKQIRQAIRTAGCPSLRKSTEILEAIRHIVIIDPPSDKCTFLGWAKHAMKVHEDKKRKSLEEKMEVYEGVDYVAPEFPILFDSKKITQLRSPRDILSEGCEMNHCVGSYVARVLSGKSYIFSISHENHRATAEINAKGDIVQVKGPHNSNNKAVEYGFSVFRKKMRELEANNKFSLPKPNKEIYDSIRKIEGARPVLALPY